MLVPTMKHILYLRKRTGIMASFTIGVSRYYDFVQAALWLLLKTTHPILGWNIYLQNEGTEHDTSVSEFSRKTTVKRDVEKSLPRFYEQRINGSRAKFTLSIFSTQSTLKYCEFAKAPVCLLIGASESNIWLKQIIEERRPGEWHAGVGNFRKDRGCGLLLCKACANDTISALDFIWQLWRP